MKFTTTIRLKYHRSPTMALLFGRFFSQVVKLSLPLQIIFFFFCSFTEIFFHATVAIPELHHIHSLFILSNQKMFFSHVLHFILRSLWCSDRIEFNLDLIPSIDKGKFCQGLSSLQCVICLD